MTGEARQVQAEVDNIKPVELLEALRQGKHLSVELTDDQTFDTVSHDIDRQPLFQKMANLAIISAGFVDDFSGVERITPIRQWRSRNGCRA